MNKIDEKTIALQTNLSINLLGKLIENLRTEPNKSLKDFFNEWHSSINWDKSDNYSIVNQGVILTHLYGLIVYPKQIFHNDIPKIKLEKVNKSEWGNFKFKKLPKSLSKTDKNIFGVDIITSENQLTLEFLIRKIRNSISHARVTIYENMDFEFEDKDETLIHFKIKGLQKFTSKFMSCYLKQEWT